MLAVVFALVTAAGCSAAGPNVEVAPGVKVQQNGGGAVTVTGPDGSSTTSGENKLPDGFPSDAPIFQPSTIAASNGSSAVNGKVYAVLLETSAPAADVWSWYQSQVPTNGWDVKSAVTTDFGGNMLCENGSQTLAVAVTDKTGVAGVTAVRLTISPAQ